MISTGYFPYAQYVRDYNPPPPVINPNSGNQLDPTQPDPRVSSTSPMYSTISNTTMPNRQSSLLNVTDPRYSATYGNPLLRQVCIKIFYLTPSTSQLHNAHWKLYMLKEAKPVTLNQTQKLKKIKSHQLCTNLLHLLSHSTETQYMYAINLSGLENFMY